MIGLFVVRQTHLTSDVCRRKILYARGMITRKLWSQSVVFFLMMLLLAILAWLFFAARPLLNALLIAGLLAYLPDPAVRWVERRFAVLFLLFGISNFLIIWFYRLGWLSLSPLGLVLLLIVVYTAIQQVDNLWLRPRLLGRTLQLHSKLLGLPSWPEPNGEGQSTLTAIKETSLA